MNHKSNSLRIVDGPSRERLYQFMCICDEPGVSLPTRIVTVIATKRDPDTGETCDAMREIIELEDVYEIKKDRRNRGLLSFKGICIIDTVFYNFVCKRYDPKRRSGRFQIID